MLLWRLLLKYFPLDHTTIRHHRSVINKGEKQVTLKVLRKMKTWTSFSCHMGTWMCARFLLNDVIKSLSRQCWRWKTWKIFFWKSGTGNEEISHTNPPFSLQTLGKYLLFYSLCLTDIIIFIFAVAQIRVANSTMSAVASFAVSVWRTTSEWLCFAWKFSCN